jgi:pimeloyl-ACP methyl ester carboxylesterase
MLKTVGIAFLASIVMLVGSCKKNDALKGIDKDALFAPPSATELQAIKANWEKRNLTPQDVTIEATQDISSKLSFHLLSFRLNGHKQYAGALVPVSTEPLPVLLYVYGFALSDPVSYQNIKLLGSDTSLPFIYVMPALKGQSLSLTVNDKTYKSPLSEGTRNDAFDGATDDAIATLNAIGTAFTQADTSRVITRGGSRGGTVALLMAARDKRVKRAAAIAFPSDLLGLTASHQQDPTYRFQFLDALINGGATLEETRTKMIASSPLYFCSELAKTQMHFGEKDDITPALQGQMLFNALPVGLKDSVKLFIYKDRTHATIGSNNHEMEERIQNFFSELW